MTLGGRGLTSTVASTFEAGFVNGMGKLPDKSVELQDTPNRIQDAAASNVIMFFIAPKPTVGLFHVNF
jgi:hypothetical protein